MGGDSVGTSSHEWVDKIVVTREAEVEKWSVVRRECRLQHKKQVQAGSSQPFRNHIWVVSKPFAAHVGPCCNASMACGGVHRERGARFVCWTYEACKELWGLWWAMGPMRRFWSLQNQRMQCAHPSPGSQPFNSSRSQTSSAHQISPYSGKDMLENIRKTPVSCKIPCRHSSFLTSIAEFCLEKILFCPSP